MKDGGIKQAAPELRGPPYYGGMPTPLARAQPGQISLQLDPSADYSDPRILQAATYALVPEAGASAAAVTAAWTPLPGTVELSHDPTDLGASYTLKIGPIKSAAGPDLPPAELRVRGTGVRVAASAAPLPKDGMVLTISPASFGPLLLPSNLVAVPQVPYPVRPTFTKVSVLPDQTVEARATGWTEIPYDLAAGVARCRTLADASVSGDAVPAGTGLSLGAGARAVLPGLQPKAVPVLDLRAVSGPVPGPDLRVQLCAAGRAVRVRAARAPDGFWDVLPETGDPPRRAPEILNLRILVDPKTQRYAVFLDQDIIAGGPVASLPADAEGAAISNTGTGPATLRAWLSEAVLADAAGNPLLALAFGVGPPAEVPVQRVLRTRKRPLTATLGPHVPAGPQDVVLTVGGVQVELAAVDPYLGLLTPKIPIPRGTREVKAEYDTTPHQVFPLSASEPGLGSSEVAAPIGPDVGFPFSVVLPRAWHPVPPRYAHRYTAFRRITSSLLGDPIGLRASRDPATPQPPPLVRDRPPAAVEVSTAAQATSPPWNVAGAGQIEPGPSGSGIQTSPAGGALLLWQDADLRDISDTYLTARLDPGPISEAPLVAGPLLGFHDESRLYAVAVLDSQGSRYVGVLLDPSKPGDLGSWSVWPRAAVRALSPSTVAADPSALPRLVAPGDRVRIPEGPQAGSYAVTGMRPSWPSGLTEIDLHPQLPADPAQYGARDATMWFDLGPGTQILRADADLQSGRLQVSAAGKRALLASDTSARPSPGALFQVSSPSEPPGRFFFGHAGPSPAALWGVLVGAAVPVEDPVRIPARTLAGPAALPDPQWAPLGQVAASPADVQITGGATPSGLLHPDRALGPDALASLRFQAQVLLGAGTLDAQAELSDGKRRIVFGSLAYDEVPGRQPYRQLVPPAQLLFDPARWSLRGPGSWDGEVLSVPAMQSAQWSAALDAPEGRILDLEAEVPTHAGSLLEIRVEGGTGSGLTTALEISRRGLSVKSHGGAQIGSRNLARTARITGTLQAGAGLVLLVNGDPVPLIAPIMLLAAPETAGRVTVTLSSTDRRAEARCRLPRLAVLRSSPLAKRTLGLLRDNLPPHDIDSWELPRTDASPAPNSAQAGPVIREMDSRLSCDCRLVLDPAWGAILLRPDLPPPPYYDPKKSRFAGDLSEPSAGWVNVSYDELPLAPSSTAYLWLAAGPGSRVRCANIAASVKARSAPGEVGFVPRSELNHQDPADSGDWAQTPYPAAVPGRPVSVRTATIRESGQWMRSLLEVLDGNRRILPPDAQLDPDGQTIRLVAGADFAGGTLLVRGLPALPVTEAYLRQLPVRGSPNEVGEGTPPIFPRYFSRPAPEIEPDPDSTGRAIEFPLPPPNKPLLARDVFTLEEPGQRDLISFPSDDPAETGNGPSGGGGPPPPPPPPDGGPVITIGGGLFWDRFPMFDDGTSRGTALLNGPFRPAGGRHRGTPTIDVPPYRPAAVLLPARGRFGRSNPDITLAGPAGKLPLPEDLARLVGPGIVTVELDDRMTKQTWRFTE